MTRVLEIKRKAPPWHGGKTTSAVKLKRKSAGRSPQANARTLEALRLFCEGLCFKKIAATLGYHPSDVSYDLVFLMRQHGLRTHAQLGIWAYLNGHVNSQSCPGATSNSGLITRTDAAAAADGAGL